MTFRADFLKNLPVADVLDEVVAASRPRAAGPTGQGGAVVVTAPPGSGKTMLVPAAVLDDLPAGSRLILLLPRRLAARSVATQIAKLRGCDLGGEVGERVHPREPGRGLARGAEQGGGALRLLVARRGGGPEGRITVAGEGPLAMVVPTDEELLIARDTVALVAS